MLRFVWLFHVALIGSTSRSFPATVGQDSPNSSGRIPRSGSSSPSPNLLRNPTSVGPGLDRDRIAQVPGKRGPRFILNTPAAEKARLKMQRLRAKWWWKMMSVRSLWRVTVGGAVVGGSYYMFRRRFSDFFFLGWLEKVNVVGPRR